MMMNTYLFYGGFMLVYGDKNSDSLFQTNKLGTIPQKDYK